MAVTQEYSPRQFAYRGADVAQTINKMADPEFHQLPFGAVLLDNDTKILRYNATEGAITNRDPRQQPGKFFFRDLAHCGFNPHFQGRFQEAIGKDGYDQTFPYVFYNAMPETPMIVRIVSVALSPIKRGAWVFVKRLPVPAA
jgi:photoactive yellow protein